MTRWSRGGGPPALRISPAEPRTAGPYQPLYDYLEHRYADMVVLSFEQIESLLGFALPHIARTEGEWWTGDAGSRGHANPCIPTSRKAVPHLEARVVAFERVTS